MTQLGLSATYDAVLQEAAEVDDLRVALIMRGIESRWQRSAERFLIDHGFGSNYLNRQNAPERLAARATDDERRQAVFPIVTAPYIVEAFANHLAARFSLNRRQAEALVKLHAERHAQEQSQQTLLRLTWLRTAVVTAAALFATQLPKDTFAALGWSDRTYGFYRLALFLVIVVALGYVLLIRVATPKSVPKSYVFARISLRWNRVGTLAHLGLIECVLRDDFGPRMRDDESPQRSE